MKNALFLAILLTLIIFSTSENLVLAVSDDVNINLQVTGIGRPVSAGVSDLLPPAIFNLKIVEITFNSATISWETSEMTRCQLFWGETQEYEKGSIAEISFSEEHSSELTDLAPAATYHFKIRCHDVNGNQSETRDQKFTTLALPDITPPTNVSNFEAVAGDSQITLRWENPPGPDFKAVKIMRSTDFYPSEPWIGTQVCDGRGTWLIDTGLTNGIRYYYTAFAYDFAGNFASGAIASAVPQRPLPPEIPPPEIPPPPEEIPPEIPPPPEIEKLTLQDFEIWQEGKKFPLIEEEKIELKAKEPLTISIDYKKIPEVLKTIMIILEKEGKSFSFLLRVNPEKTAFGATILVPEAGDYSLTFIISDYKNQTLKKISGEMEVKEVEKEETIVFKPPGYTKIKNWILNLITRIWQWIKNILSL